jgi:hypothetical protein
MHSDFRDLLRLFNAHKVRYLVIGGYAVMKYTEPRYTKDLDVWVEATPRNAKAVFKALRKFEAPLANLTEADFATEGFFYQMGRPPARVDILMSIRGVLFADAWSNRVVSDFDGVTGYVISRKDLIANKKAVGRPQDLVDLNSLVESEPPAAQVPAEPEARKKRPKRRRRDPGPTDS